MARVERLGTDTNTRTHTPGDAARLARSRVEWAAVGRGRRRGSRAKVPSFSEMRRHVNAAKRTWRMNARGRSRTCVPRTPRDGRETETSQAPKHHRECRGPELERRDRASGVRHQQRQPVSSRNPETHDARVRPRAGLPRPTVGESERQQPSRETDPPPPERGRGRRCRSSGCEQISWSKAESQQIAVRWLLY